MLRRPVIALLAGATVVRSALVASSQPTGALTVTTEAEFGPTPPVPPAPAVVTVPRFTG